MFTVVCVEAHSENLETTYILNRMNWFQSLEDSHINTKEPLKYGR